MPFAFGVLWAGLSAVLTRFLLLTIATVISKVVIFAALMYVFDYLYDKFHPMIKDSLPTWASDFEIANVMVSLPNEMFFFFELARLEYGIKMIVGAYIVRFTIRRIPIFG